MPDDLPTHLMEGAFWNSLTDSQLKKEMSLSKAELKFKNTILCILDSIEESSWGGNVNINWKLFWGNSKEELQSSIWARNCVSEATETFPFLSDVSDRSTRWNYINKSSKPV